MRRDLVLFVSLLTCLAVGGVASGRGPDESDIARWAAMLPSEPRGLGPTIEDRSAWEAISHTPGFANVISRAESLIETPMPELTDDIYLDYSRTGQRQRGERVLRQRQGRVSALVLAECIENRGRFLPAIEQAIRSVCGEKSWLFPAHDNGLANFKGTEITIDLESSAVSWSLATVRYWLGDRLAPDVRKLIRDELERRTFTPFTKLVTTGKPAMWWLTGSSNWTAVCLSGVTGAAMAAVESPERRAFFAATAEKHIQNYLSGFTPDGYCSEGLGYWNYGFGHFTMLAETLRRASGGKFDIMQEPRVALIAQFGRRMEILPGIFPCFADCRPGTRPDPQLSAFLARRYGWALRPVATRTRAARGRDWRLFVVGLYDFPDPALPSAKASATTAAAGLRDWFSDAGILICRPEAGSRHALGAALKGGNNGEMHNHNDVGSYVVALGRSTPLLDPGSEVYTARTFSSRRYDSNVLNSFGHPVPRVAGQLQATGRQAAAKILRADFSDATDTLVLDLAAAYRVKPLEKLIRTFVFSRTGSGKLTVTDKVAFDTPETFGTALITFGPWKQLSSHRLRVGEEPDAVTVEVVAEGAEARISAEQIHEDLPGGRIPTRIGIDLAKPVTNAKIMLGITP